MKWLVLLDDHEEGPFGNMRWGPEGELSWKVVEAENRDDAIKEAFANQYTLSQKREADAVQDGDIDFPWHRAVAFSMDELDAFPVTRFRMTAKTETVFRLEVDPAAKGKSWR